MLFHKCLLINAHNKYPAHLYLICKSRTSHQASAKPPPILRRPLYPSTFDIKPTVKLVPCAKG